MKAIALRAGVSPALLHYHFGTKEGLYAEVIRSRSRRINDRRRALLDAVDPDGPEALDRMLDALFRPTLGPDGGGRAYARIFAGLIVGHERDRALVRECYDPTARLFIEAMARTGLGRARAGVAYQLALGALASVISRDGRMERLMGGGATMGTEALIATLVAFVRGGAQALATDDTKGRTDT
jgi:AcrR family transcriptional regulator